MQTVRSDSLTVEAFSDSLFALLLRRRVTGMRVEVVCSNCGGHMGKQLARLPLSAVVPNLSDFHVFLSSGHVFKNEGFPTPTNERHCVNSVSIKYKE